MPQKVIFVILTRRTMRQCLPHLLRQPQHLSQPLQHNQSLPQSPESTSIPQSPETTSIPQSSESTSTPQSSSKSASTEKSGCMTVSVSAGTASASTSIPCSTASMVPSINGSNLKLSLITSTGSTHASVSLVIKQGSEKPDGATGFINGGLM